MKLVYYLKSLALMMLALTAACMTAANVDSHDAQARAIKFLNNQSGTRFMASSATVLLTYTEVSSVNPRMADFYVFNQDGGGFVIIAGDDRAEEVLGYGNGTLDMNTIPDNMRWWLSQYKEQIEFLIANPKAQVKKLSESSTKLRASTVAPLLTCSWGQKVPYWLQCPTYNGQNCCTGCVATAMAQVMHYWKYPSKAPALSSYTTSTHNIPVPALPGTTLDWDNMSDEYSLFWYSYDEAMAVSTLMRYCGQACLMDYSPESSGAYTDDQLAAMKAFGYNSGATRVKRVIYSDEQWTAMILEDLQAGRPVLYGGDDGSSGHAFVVDGYDGSMYHINWGWSGEYDNYFAISAFMPDSNHDYRLNQDMLYQIYPENLEKYAPVMLDACNVDNTSFLATWIDQTPRENVIDYTLYVQTYDSNNQSLFTETFAGATGEGSADVSGALDEYTDNAGWTGSSVFTVAGGLKMGSSKNAGILTTPALDLSTISGTITVKFNSAYWSESDNTSITVSCDSVSQTVQLTGTATDYAVVLEGVTPAAGQKVTFASSGGKKRFFIYSVEVITGDASLNMLKATETGDAYRRVITGITDKGYTVNGLNEGGNYKFYVEANYTDSTKAVSNFKSVTLLTEQAHEYQLGDVNHDGAMNIADVTTLIDSLLSGSEVCSICADLNGDNAINIADVTALIDKLLSGN